MKIRTDYVTNSSSSSYCIMGVGDDIVEIIRENIGDKELYDVIEMPLEYNSIMHEGDYAVGLGVDSMQETESRQDFRRRAYAALVTAFPFLIDHITEKDVDWIVDGGRDW